MRGRIWNELCETIFYAEYLGLYIGDIKRWNTIMETTLLATSIFSIAGLGTLAEYHIVWMVLLSIVSVIRILKPRFMISEQEITTLEAVRNFYLDHSRNLDEFWFKYEGDKISESQAEKSFKKLSEEERLMIKLYKHDKLSGQEPIHSQAENLANKKLIKYNNYV